MGLWPFNDSSEGGWGGDDISLRHKNLKMTENRLWLQVFQKPGSPNKLDSCHLEVKISVADTCRNQELWMCLYPLEQQFSKCGSWSQKDLCDKMSFALFNSYSLQYSNGYMMCFITSDWMENSEQCHLSHSVLKNSYFLPQIINVNM